MQSTLSPNDHGAKRYEVTKRVRRRAASALVALLALGAVAPGIAAAGTAGQQIIVDGYQQYSVTICGYNQHAAYNCGHFNTPGFSTPITGWWWEGDVTLYNYAKNGAPLQTTYCEVPYVQASNWTVCHAVG